MPRGCERDSGKRGTVMRARMMLLALLGTAAALAAGCASGAPNVRGGMLVSTEWLAARLSDPSVVVVQVGMDRKAYDAGHVPGARFLAWNDVAVTRGVPNEIPPMPDLMVTVRRLGLDAEKKVVLYDDAGGLPAARAYVALDYVGLGDCTAMLDGHWQRWTAEGRPISRDVPAVESSSYAPRLRPEVVVTLRAMEDYVYAKNNIGGTSVEFVDARPPNQYSGEEPGEGMADGDGGNHAKFDAGLFVAGNKGVGAGNGAAAARPDADRPDGERGASGIQGDTEGGLSQVLAH